MHRRLDLASVFTSEFIDRFNAFDADAVRAQARAFQAHASDDRPRDNSGTRQMTRQKFTIGLAIPDRMGPAYGYLAPIVAMGYDREEGLDLAIFYGGEPGATAHSLCSGACDIAFLNTIVGFIGRAEGLPMVAIGSKARRAHRYFAVLPNSPIRSLHDLTGKRIACDFPHLHPLAEAALVGRGRGAAASNGSPGAAQEWRSRAWSRRCVTARSTPHSSWTGATEILRRAVPPETSASRSFWKRSGSPPAIGRPSALPLAPTCWRVGCAPSRRASIFSFANPEAALQLMWQTFPEARPAVASDGEMRGSSKSSRLASNPCGSTLTIRTPVGAPCRPVKAGRSFCAAPALWARFRCGQRCYSTALVDPANAFDAAPIRAARRIGGTAPRTMPDLQRAPGSLMMRTRVRMRPQVWPVSNVDCRSMHRRTNSMPRAAKSM